MQISLTAVLEDGTPRRGLVPADPRQTLRIPQGSDVTLRVSVVTPGGSLVDLTGAGTELLLTIKKNPKLWHDSWPRVTKKASVVAGIGVFLLEPGDTHDWLAGMYAWDVWLTKDGSRDAVIPTSPLQLLQSVAPVPERPPPPTLELVAGDTEPLILDFSGTDITGWIIELHIGYPTPLEKIALLTDPLNGIAQIDWDESDLVAGVWSGEIEITKPGPFQQTSDVFIFDIRAPVAP